MSKKTVTSEITNKNELVIKNLEKEIHPYKKNHRTHHK